MSVRAAEASVDDYLYFIIRLRWYILLKYISIIVIKAFKWILINRLELIMLFRKLIFFRFINNKLILD